MGTISTTTAAVPAASPETAQQLQLTISGDVFTLLKQILSQPLQTIIANPSLETVTAQGAQVTGSALGASPVAQADIIRDTAQFLLSHVSSLTLTTPVPNVTATPAPAGAPAPAPAPTPAPAA